MLKIRKDQILLALLIILITVIYGLPHLILFSKLGKNYTPFSLFPNSPSAILAGLSFLTGSLGNAFIVSDFIFPPILFLIIYLFLRNYLGNIYYRLTTSFLIVTARDLITLIPYPISTFKYLTAASHQEELLFLSRTPHPQISLIFLFAGVWALYKLLSKPDHKRFIFLTGLFFGLLFYTYMFYFTFFSLFFLLIFIYFLVKKDKMIVKSLLISGLITAIIASYYIYNVIQFYRLDIATDFSEKLKVLNSPF